MLIETIWAAIHSCVSMLLIVSTLAGGFYLCGRFVLRILRLTVVESSSIPIAAGISVTAVLGWYAYRFGFPLSGFIATAFLAMIVITAFMSIRPLKHFLQNGRIPVGENLSSLYIFPLFVLAFSLQAMIAFKTTTFPVGTIGNNDIYDWSILAEHLIGSPGYSNVFTASGGTAQQYRTDSFGTFFILGTVSKFIGTSALEATPTFTILSLSLIGLSIFDVIKRFYSFSDPICFGIALLVSAGAFFFYVAYNNFYGQLLATFFYLTAVGVLLHIAEAGNKLSLAKGALLSVFSLAGILIVYQSGFFVFAMSLLGFCAIYGAFATSFRVSYAAVINGGRVLLVPCLCGIAVTALVLPELAQYTVQRTILVKDVPWGWPLPLIDPAYLLSIPVLKAFPGQIGLLSHYAVALSVLIAIFAFAYFSARRQSAGLAVKVGASAAFFLISFAAYLLAYLIKGNAYQVWKFAAFAVLSTSFVFLSITVLAVYQSNKFADRVRKLISPAVVCAGVFVVALVPALSKVISNAGEIEQLLASKQILKNSGVENVVLQAMEYGEVMIAFNILSRDFKVFPLVETYVAPVSMSLIRQLDPAKTRALARAKCYSEGRDPQDRDGYKIVPIDGWPTGKHYFTTSGATCAVARGVQLKEGFSGPEHWGTWTEGNRARVQVNVPPALVGKGVNVLFDVHPFGPEQTVSVSVNGQSSGSWVVREPTTLKINIPASLSDQGQLQLDFYIERPLRPKDVAPPSEDHRLLGLGFGSFSMNPSPN